MARGSSAEGLAVDAAHMLAIASAGDEATSWNLRALEMAEGSSREEARRWIPSLCNNLGWTHHDAGRHAEALALFERALEERTTRGGDARSVRIARWTVARALRSLGRADEALGRQRALLAETDEGGEGSPDGFVHEEIGECLLALGRADEAAPHFARAHALLAQDPWLREREPARLERLATLGAVGGTPAE